jgi:hypothetical protein
MACTEDGGAEAGQVQAWAATCLEFGVRNRGGSQADVGDEAVMVRRRLRSDRLQHASGIGAA